MFQVYVAFCFFVVWLSVPVHAIAWKEYSSKWPVMCRASTRNFYSFCCWIQVAERSFRNKRHMRL